MLLINIYILTFCKISENVISRMSRQADNVIVFAKTLAKIYGMHFQIFRKLYNSFKRMRKLFD